jgi:DUF4097 and DUF4098 domain-containing protein YvlB
MNNTRTLSSTSVSSRSLSSQSWTRRSLASSLTIALVVIFSTTLLSTAASASSTPQGTFDRTLTVSGPVDLEVLTHSGDVSIRTGASAAVIIHAKIFVSDHWLRGNRQSDVDQIVQNPPIRQDGNRIHIDYLKDVHDISVDYEVTVPAETVVHAHSGSGDLDIEGTHGNADLQTGSGNVKLSHVSGEIRLQTGSGDIRAKEVSGAVHGGTGSGDVEIAETGSGDVDIHTGSGNIGVRGIQGGFRGEAGSGDITADGTQAGPWEIRTGSGNVRLHLPSSAAFDADISTSSGTIEVNAPVEMTVQGRIEEARKQIRGKVRGGGPLLSVRTGSGDIHVD